MPWAYGARSLSLEKSPVLTGEQAGWVLVLETVAVKKNIPTTPAVNWASVGRPVDVHFTVGHLKRILFLYIYVPWIQFHPWSCDSSVGIALGYGLDDRGSRVLFPAGAGNFSLHHRVQNPPIQWIPGALSLGVKWLGPKADHSPPSIAEVKEWVELYLHSPIRLHGMVLSYSTWITLPSFSPLLYWVCELWSTECWDLYCRSVNLTATIVRRKQQTCPYGRHFALPPASWSLIS
jgi:hypothetical protein